MLALRDWRFSGLAALCLLASACGREEAAAPLYEGNDTSAKGEVLEGTISDAMIPYDEIGRDAPPPVPQARTERSAAPAARSTAREEARAEDAAENESSAEAEQSAEKAEAAAEE